MEVDVAIIGAGPAGSLCATLLAQRGHSVLLLDRDEFPRQKVCGEFLSYDGVAVLDAAGLGSLLDREGATQMKKARLFVGDAALEFELPLPARGLSRYRLDAALLGAAAAAGATVWTGATVEGVTGVVGDHELRLVRGGDSDMVRAKCVVGAWGRWGRLDRQLGRAFLENRSTRHYGFQRHYAAGAPDSIDLYSFDRGYLGVSAVEEGKANICGLVHETRIAGMKGRWEGFSTALTDESSRLRDLFDRDDGIGGFISSDPVIFSARSPVAGELMLIGDSAAMIDPLTGNGMSLALQSALLVAPFVSRTVARRTGESANYAAAYRTSFRSRLRWSRVAAMLLSNPGRLRHLLRLPFTGRVAGLFVRGTRAAASEVDRLAAVWFSQR